ncbi:probable crossover junction endonuclease EME2 [Rhineura floridana]|uniref:probable crossover junction endonuclease EME2 n=1 Tax=Rhineura floridana TaxID=261503 RepID=UPI002AC875DF|nr:probable crossover junction endonuclease EME2 [Rhineura floridana]XP_061455562.1 probable crossover junction endonuclease EME2 [Rhineura floridana]XP_061455563.1 probable crossover junction endonuclease EME2 [Rhineura floridana]
MEEGKKNDALDRTAQLVKRAVTWEISDSEGDNDIELRDLATGGSPLAAGDWDHVPKEKLEMCVSANEPKELPFFSSLPQAGSCSPEKRKKKRSTKGLETAQTKAKAQKLERELKKEERRRRKEQCALEKERRKENAAAFKSLRPDQCTKLMTVCVDPGLLEDPGSDALLGALESLEYKYHIEPQTIPRSITWKRDLSSSMPCMDGPQEQAEEEREILVLLEPWDFLRHLFSLMQSIHSGRQQNMPDLTQLLPFNNLEGHHSISYSVVVVGLDAYRWYNQHHGHQEEEKAQASGFQLGPELPMTDHQIEEALVVLQLWSNACVSSLETWQDFAQHVSAMTKAIAQRPYKKQQENWPFSFCTDGRWASGVRVHKDGTGLRQAWSRQLQQFNRVSPAMAAAIAETYPSPSLLFQAYRECRTEKEKQLLLSDIPVRTEENERQRRIGPDLSRRIYLFMVSTNPELVLDLSA